MLKKSLTSADLRMELVTSVPTFIEMASAAPSFAPMTAWWMRLRRSASSWALDRVVMASAMVVPLELAAVAAVASCLASSSTVLAVGTVVDLMRVMCWKPRRVCLFHCPGHRGCRSHGGCGGCRR